jgi:hypothetical protein
MFFWKKKTETVKYDPELRKPAIRVSICTGEQVAGFRNLETGRFEEIALIRDQKDLYEFKKRYGIEGEIEKFY